MSVEFPMIARVCEYFDCDVIWDYAGDEKTGYRDVCFIGDDGDMSVGLWPYTLTSGHETKQELEAWLNTLEGQDEVVFNAQGTFPDYPFDGKGIFDDDSES